MWYCCVFNFYVTMFVVNKLKCDCCSLIFYSVNLLNSLISSRSFCCLVFSRPLGIFLADNYAICTQWWFYFFFYNLYVFSFSCLIAVASLFSLCWMKVLRADIASFLILKWKHSVFSSDIQVTLDAVSFFVCFRCSSSSLGHFLLFLTAEVYSCFVVVAV